MSNWDKISPNYDKLVYSITRFKAKRNRILREIKDNSNILIIGCGSATYLQKDIMSKYPNVKVTLSDYSPGMLEESKKSYNHSNFNYVCEDMSKIKYKNEFDYVITTNSILFPTIKENDHTIELIIDALKETGKLIGYFPSYESCQNLVRNSFNLPLDYKEQSLDDGCGYVQSFFKRDQLEKLTNKGTPSINVVNCSESYSEIKDMMKIYGLSKNQAKMVFEFFLVFSKKSNKFA